MKLIIPIILVIVSGVAFWMFINPRYAHVQELRAQAAQFDEALNRSKELIGIRDKLLSKYNTFDTDDLERLHKLLPDTVDNVRLILDIDGIAGKYGMTIRNVTVKEAALPADTIGPSTESFGSIGLEFSTAASYENFVRFLTDLEESLRIVDVTDISFSADESDFYQYTVALKTYWLR